jgi:hypothetical protein
MLGIANIGIRNHNAISYHAENTTRRVSVTVAITPNRKTKTTEHFVRTKMVLLYC